jgi:hypothetical protein
MAIASKDILTLLMEWPSRMAGSEAELEAREALMAKLSGEYGVDIKEEGVYAPPHGRYHAFLLILLSLITISLFFLSPIIGVIALALLGYIVLNIVTGRRSPLILMIGAKITANLIASKGSGEKCILILAALDTYSDPYSAKLPTLFNEFDQSKNIDAAASIAAASRLWKNIPDGYAIRLCLFSGTVAGNTGIHQYIQQHSDELKAVDVNVYSLNKHILPPFIHAGFKYHSVDMEGDTSATGKSNALEALIMEKIDA